MSDAIHRRQLATGLVGALALAWPVASRAGAATDRAVDAAQPFAQAWAQLPGTSGWQMLVSIPFPLVWPPDAGRPGTAVARYAYAMRLRPGLADGAEMAAPWARSTEAADGTVTVTLLQAGLHPLGIQGVRPLGTADMALLAREPEAAGLLRAGAADPLVRATTCGWIARNGVVAASIAPRHPVFVRWLACESRPGQPP